MSFNDFVQNYILKSKTTSNIKIKQVLSSSGLNDVDLYLRHGPFSSDIGIVIFYRSRGTHWVCYINKNYFDSHVCAPPNKLSKFVLKRNGHCFYSEYKIQKPTSKRDSHCARYCCFIIYLTKVIGVDYKSSVLDLYYQMIDYC